MTMNWIRKTLGIPNPATVGRAKCLSNYHLVLSVTGIEMLHFSKGDEIIGINWGSSNFRAYHIAQDGAVLGEYSEAIAISSLDKAGMAGLVAKAARDWPPGIAVYASGMIGSNIGWTEVPYASAPAGGDELSRNLKACEIGNVVIRILPGIACKRAVDGDPDVLRGEETELLGLTDMGYADGLAILPGTHTKWVRFQDGRIVDFFTSMSGEIFDRLTQQGLLASIVEDPAALGKAFREGVSVGRNSTWGLATLLFGARAKVMRGELSRVDAASYIRGLLIGVEIADGVMAYPQVTGSTVPLIGASHFLSLYADALNDNGISSRAVHSRDACVNGFRKIHALVNA